MRRVFFIASTIVLEGLIAAACDEGIERDPSQRFYIAPDAEDPGVPREGGLVVEEASTDAGSDAPVLPTFDPGTLALTGWWRGGFAAPWAGTASAGPSAAQSLTAASNPPTTGGALNGLAVGDFDGTNDHLLGAALSTFFTPSAFSGWALVQIDTVNTDNASWLQNDAILGSSGTAQVGLFLRDNGTGAATVGLAVFITTADRIVTTPIAKAIWQLVQWKSDGATIKIRVNGNAWASAEGGAVNSLAAPLELGFNPAANNFFDGRAVDVGLAASVLSDADFDNVRRYASGRYGLEL